MSRGRSSIDRPDLSSEATGRSNAGRELRKLIRNGHSFSGLERNCCFLNLGKDADGNQRSFANVSATSGVDLKDDARAIALTDWNFDGQIDWFCLNRSGPQLRLFTNRRDSTRNRFLKVLLEGAESPRDPIGARIVLELRKDGSQRPVRLRRTLRAGDGYLSQSSKWIHFGLGDFERIEKITIHWPIGGQATEFTKVATNQHLIIKQGSQSPERWTPPAWTLKAPTEKVADDSAIERAAAERGTLVTHPLPMPSALVDLLPPDSADARYCLLTLWASWCQPCLEELATLSSEQTRLATAGVCVLPINVEVEASQETRSETLTRLGLSFDERVAAESHLEQLQFLHDQIVDLHLPLPIPCSFLVDRKERVLLALYKGPVDVSRVVSDVRIPTQNPERRRLAGSWFAGEWSGKPAQPRVLLSMLDLVRSGQIEDAYAWVQRAGSAVERDSDFHILLFSFGQELTKRGRHRQAIAFYRNAIQRQPQLEPALYNLGTSHAVLGEHPEAIRYFERAYALDPAPRTALLLAKSYSRTGALSRAREILEAAISKSARGDIAYELALVLALSRQYGDVERAYRRAVENDKAQLGVGKLKQLLAALTWNDDAEGREIASRIKSWVGDQRPPD